jgi:DNA excision repair protein ERCC-4
MIIQEEQDGKKDLNFDDKDKQPIKSQMNSRIGGAQEQQPSTSADADKTMKVIVDMREFRSELPSILHKKGFHIEPCTLEVGDYVITPTICVERKSINDLIESLSNGRLYNQCNAMSRAYKIPMLLIEFDRNKPFLLNVCQSLNRCVRFGSYTK